MKYNTHVINFTWQGSKLLLLGVTIRALVRRVK